MIRTPRLGLRVEIALPDAAGGWTPAKIIGYDRDHNDRTSEITVQTLPIQSPAAQQHTVPNDANIRRDPRFTGRTDHGNTTMTPRKKPSLETQLCEDIVAIIGTASDRDVIRKIKDLLFRYSDAQDAGDKPTNDQYRAAAEKEYASEGQIEIDSDAAVSRGNDPGAYVQAWVWVYNDSIPGFAADDDDDDPNVTAAPPPARRARAK